MLRRLILCVPSTEQLMEERKTIADPYDKQGAKLVVSDVWNKKDASRQLMGDDRWTGVTEFKVCQNKSDDETENDPIQRMAEESERAQNQEEDDVIDDTAVQDDTEQGVIRAPMKPLYDFRRVLHRLPCLAERDRLQAERLLLGLHERFWRAGVGDMTNLLIRAGNAKCAAGSPGCRIDHRSRRVT